HHLRGVARLCGEQGSSSCGRPGRTWRPFITDSSAHDRACINPAAAAGEALLLQANFSGDEMAATRTIDTHTHILTEETAALLTEAGVQVTMTPDDADNAALDVVGIVYRPFPTGRFDIPRRLKDMDAAGVDVH